MADEIQQELEVLESIFMDDFEKVESPTAWKAVNAAHEFRICVKPLEEDLKDQISLRIHFKIPLRYPKVVPTWTLEKPQGLSPAQVQGVNTALLRSALSLVGGEMIYELCSQAAALITDRHLAFERGQQTSLGEERAKRAFIEDKKRIEAQKAAEAVAESLRSRKAEEEATRLSLLISEDFARKEETRLEREKRELTQLRESNERVQAVEVGGLSEIQMFVTRGERERRAKVRLGLAIAGEWIGRVLPAEVSVEKDSFSATAHVFDILAPYFLTPQGKRKLNKVEQDLELVRNIRHAHLSAVYGSLLTRYAPSIDNRTLDGYTLVVLVEPIRSQTLQDLLSACGELRPDRAITYLLQLAGAVESIHNANIVHGGIRPQMIFVGGEKGKSAEVGIKLSGASWYQRLVNLNKSDPWSSSTVLEEELPDSWICPAALEDPFNYDKSRDMWDMGVIFAQMLVGLDLFHRYPSPSELIRDLSNTTHRVARQILSDLLLNDARKRPTAGLLLSQVLESSTSAQTVVPSTPTATSLSPWKKDGSRGAFFSPMAQLSRSVEAPSGLFWQPRPSGSRYRSEFEELEFLGRGGGGQVVKARNRLDGSLYAVKKIRLPNDRASEAKILREVTIWSRMNHPNIVRYHTSWVETDHQPHTYDPDAGSSRTTATTIELDTDDSNSNSDAASDFDEDESDIAATELDMDLGLEDLNDIDFLSTRHSKSVSYPSIHFGLEDDAPSTHENSAYATRISTRASSPTPLAKHVRTLYIQMEYVEKLTLKEAIEDGVTEMDCWRLMFQILSAMLHFTSLNIIHRDLKPSNIFIDVKGDVRIGDFGLAVNQGLADPTDVLLSMDSSLEEAELTSGIGTSLYIAPETLSRGRIDRHVKYSNKIDMYSLGIVFFELWQPFKTGMERIHVLRDLRKPEILFPPAWDEHRLSRQCKIVRTCLVHDPELRSSPKELLDSDLLPPRVGDDSIVETIRLLSHSGTQHAQTLISALFNTSSEDQIRKDFSYDFYDGQGAKVDNDPYGEIVRDKLQRIFRRKGAVCMDSPLLMPQSHIYGNRNPVRLLDSDGTIVCLPFQLNIPFCRMVARESLTRIKRWTIAPIYRTLPSGGQPNSVLNAAFDIVSDASTTVAAEVEVILIADEIAAAFPFDGETIHYLNHSKILDALLERIPVKRRSAVLDVLAQHGRLNRSWTKTAGELLKITGISKANIDELGALDVSGDISDIRSRILSTSTTLKHVAREGLDELQDIVSLCHQIGVKRIMISPLLATDYDFHKDGSFFESVIVRGRSRELIASGGRFDDVVARLAAPDVRFSGRLPHVVGVSIAVAKLSQCVADANATTGKAMMTNKNEWERSFGPWAVRRCDVYVVSFFTPGLVDLRLDIAKDLWKAGINADLMYDDNLLTLTPEQLVSACRREGILWLVIVKPKSSEEHVKLKSVLRNFEEEAKRSDLIPWILKELGKQSTIDGAVIANSEAIQPLADPAFQPPDARVPRQDYFGILFDGDVRHKGKHKQRTMMIQKAQENIKVTAASASTAPVFAIDIEGLSFSKMCESARWISDDDAFRQVLHAAPASKRDYLLTIRENLVQFRIKKPDSRLVWLFSLRDDRSCLLTLEW